MEGDSRSRNVDQAMIETGEAESGQMPSSVGDIIMLGSQVPACKPCH